MGSCPAGPPLRPGLITGNTITVICSCLARVKTSLYLVSENVFARMCSLTYSYAQHNKRYWPKHPSCLQLDRQSLPFSGPRVSEVPACCMSYLAGFRGRQLHRASLQRPSALLFLFNDAQPLVIPENAHGLNPYFSETNFYRLAGRTNYTLT